MKKRYFLITILTGFALLPAGVAGQTVNMGTAAPYCLFTKAGAITDANSADKSAVTGRLGTFSGAYSGFDPAYDNSVAGAPPQHETNASALQQVANDVDAAIVQINAMPNSAVTLASTLGGQTITPGVYDIAPATSLAGDVTLDGLGQTNPLFVFKIGGAFTTVAPYQVLLINGATLNNVFWRMGGAVTLAPGKTSVFRGIILVLSAGAISMGNGTTLLGKALTQAGAMNLDNNRVSNAELVPQAPMPVELTSFEVQRQGAGAQLRWATALEKNNAYFAVESSPDGKFFTEVGRVPGHGNSSQARAYAWAEASLARYSTTMVYYRLHQLDADGSGAYSPIRSVARSLADDLHLRAYPNPTTQPFRVQVDVACAGPATFQLLDAQGRTVLQQALVLGSGTTSLSLDEATELRPGLYLLQFQHGGQRQLLRLVRE